MIPAWEVEDIQTGAKHGMIVLDEDSPLDTNLSIALCSIYCNVPG